MTEQPSLFVPKVTRPAKRVAPKSDKPVWTRYHSEKAKRPYPCDHCMLNMVDDPHAPAARLARYRRRTPEGLDLYLCVPHANDQRVVDGLEVVSAADRPKGASGRGSRRR